jgi:hypothetical protein
MAQDIIRNKNPGLMAGAMVDSIFLPNNPILDDYKITNNPSLFTFKCSAFKAPEMSIKADNGNITVTADKPTEPLAEFEFIFNQESFSLNHSHNWGEVGGIIGTIRSYFNQGVLGLKGDTILAALQGANQLISTGQTAIRTDWNAFGSLDLAKSYQGTESSDINISFVLFTSKDPFVDVMLPATFLTYMSYPKLRSSKEDIKNMLSLLDGLRNQGKTDLRLSQNKAQPEKTTNVSMSKKTGDERDAMSDEQKTEYYKQQEIAKNLDTTMNSVINAVKSSTVDKWRYRLGFSPPSWVVSASNGSVFLNNAALTNVGIVYHGPWISSKQVQATFSEDILKEVFSNSPGLKSDIDGSLSGFPSWAEVTLTFKNNFQQVFGEEWMMGIAAGASHFPKVTTSSRVN